MSGRRRLSVPAILARVVLALGPTVRRWVRYEVDVQTLDYFCQQANRLPTVLKIDVEGWEYPALCGAEQTLGGGSVRLVVFESECGATGQILDPRISQLLEDCGFVIRHVPRSSGVIKPTENYQAYLGN